MQAKKVREVADALEEAGGLSDLRAALKTVLAAVTDMGYTQAIGKGVIDLVIAEEVQPPQLAPSASFTAPRTLRKTLQPMSLTEMYSKYVDSHTLYEPELKKLDVRAIVTSIAE